VWDDKRTYIYCTEQNLPDWT